MDGKGASIWDAFVDPGRRAIVDGSDGKVACDSYHRYKEDVKLIKRMGMKSYRFSIAWTRIFPEGESDAKCPFLFNIKCAIKYQLLVSGHALYVYK